MKHSLLLSTLVFSVPFVGNGQVVIIEEDFESYNVSDPIAQTAGLPWSTWSGATGTAEDATISSEQANSGTKSLKISGVAGGGPIDQVLRLGDRTSGTYTLSWNMYIPTGFGAYFNLQHNEVIGAGSWMMDVTFDPDGSVEYLVNNIATAGSFEHDTWFPVSMVINLDAQTGTVSIDNGAPYAWQTNVPGPNRLGAVNIYAYAGGGTAVPTFYLDDVLFMQMSGVGVNDVQSFVTSIYPNPVMDILTIDHQTNTGDAIVSLVDLTGRIVREGIQFQQNGDHARAWLSLSGLPTGIYMVRIQDGSTELVRRITKL
jgi:hypothetical protein